MALESLGFRVTSTAGGDPTDCVPVTVSSVACLQIGGSTTIAKVSALDELKTVVTDFLAQPIDGDDQTERTIYAGKSTGADIVVRFTRDPGTDRELDTVQVMSVPVWKRSKAGFFVQGLTDFGFVP